MSSRFSSGVRSSPNSWPATGWGKLVIAAITGWNIVLVEAVDVETNPRALATEPFMLERGPRYHTPFNDGHLVEPCPTGGVFNALNGSVPTTTDITR